MPVLLQFFRFDGVVFIDVIRGDLKNYIREGQTFSATSASLCDPAGV